MDQESRNMITRAYKRTEQLLIENTDKLHKVCEFSRSWSYLRHELTSTIILVQLAEALLKKETLAYEEVEQLIEPPPFGKKRLVEPADFESSMPIPPTQAESPPPQPAAS